MAIMDPVAAHDFYHYLHGSQEEVQAGVVTSPVDAASAHWTIWEQFCRRFSLDPTLQGIKDPVIPILQAFAYAYRHGHIIPLPILQHVMQLANHATMPCLPLPI
jgi:hypothetical protein